MILDRIASRAHDTNLSRRNFLVAGAAAGGGLMLSLSLPFGRGEAAAADSFAPNAFIRIGSNGEIVLTMPYVEMGQGTYTSIPMLIAEELEVNLKQIRLEHAPPNEKLYVNPMLGVQATGNSNAMRGGWKPMRQAGATARMMLIAVAAKRWAVDAKTCRAQDGTVIHDATGRRLTYGDLAADAALIPVPQDVPLKRPEEFKLIGTRAQRLDAPGKVNGSAMYGIDARPPGVRIATLAQSPVFGGRLKSVDDSAAKAVKGVRQIVRLDDAVAVVADHMGAAKKGLEALKIEWDEGPNAGLNSADITRQLEQATLKPGAVAQKIGDADKAMNEAATKVEATYQIPFLAHATMEPMNCTVHVRKDECEIWIGTQAIARLQAFAAKAAGLPVEKVIVHNHLIGGGFGRRLEADMAVRAVQIAQQVDGPVKVVWTREEDIQHDMYRPYWFDRLSAGLDKDGKVTAWKNRYAGPSVIARWLPPAYKDGLDPDSTEGAIGLVYGLPNLHVEFVRTEPQGVPTAFWRSVGPSHNVFVTESFIDELAAAAKQDPIAYRRALLDHNPRAKAVLDLAAEKSNWGQPLPKGYGRGVSIQNAFGSILAQVAEVEVAKDGSVRVHRVVCAMDCGTVVNPDTVEAQLQSGVMFGTTAALYGEITIKNGRVEQSNFDTYQILRMNEAPAVEVHLVKSSEPPGGMGENGVSAMVPAIANAVFAATGKRLRKMPVDSNLLKA
ncbi:xanthine dehydrogenase family protein molybdopterin-binding subunit [Bradyrhizobium sp. UFLA05-109]